MLLLKKAAIYARQGGPSVLNPFSLRPIVLTIYKESGHETELTSKSKYRCI